MRFFRVISNLLRFDRTNWTALTLCLFAAAIFWIFNALDENYSSNLSLPLNLEFDKEKYATAERIPAKLTVNVNGKGWELLRNSLGQKVPVISIPLERPAETHRIPGASVAPLVASQLGSLQLNFVVLDTLRLTIEPRISRKLKLVADVSQVTYRNNLGPVSPPVVIPDSIQLEGPASYLVALGNEVVIKVPPMRASANYRQSLEVSLEKSEFIERNPPVADVLFEVAPVVELSRELLLQQPRGSTFAVDRDTIRVRLRIPGRDQDRFNSDFELMTVTLPQLKLDKGDTIRLLPLMEGLPEYAQILYVDSVEVRRRPLE